MTFSLPVFLIISILTVTLSPGPVPLRRVLLVLFLLTLLVLTGATGLPFVPLGILWVLCSTFSRTGPHSWWSRPVVVVLSAGVASLVPAYFVGFHFPRHEYFPRELSDILGFLGRLVNLGFGLAGYPYWQFGCAMLAVFSLFVAAKAAWDFVKHPGLRSQLGGVLVGLLGAWVLTAIIAWGRAGLHIRIFHPAPRYVTLMALIPCALFLFGALNQRNILHRILQISLFLFLCLLSWGNYEQGLSLARNHFRARQRPAYHALSAGISVGDFVDRYGSTVFPRPDELRSRCEMLRKAGVGRFAGLRAEESKR